MLLWPGQLLRAGSPVSNCEVTHPTPGVVFLTAFLITTHTHACVHTENTRVCTLQCGHPCVCMHTCGNNCTHMHMLTFMHTNSNSLSLFGSMLCGPHIVSQSFSALSMVLPEFLSVITISLERRSRTYMHNP